MTLRVLDLARQARQGAAFVLPVESGGSGRPDGFARGLARRVLGASGVSQYAPVKEKFYALGSGPGLVVEACDDVEDVPIGIAQESPASDGALIVVITAGISLALVTGAVVPGDLLYPTATGRLSAAPGVGGYVGRALEPAASGDHTIWISVGPHPTGGGGALTVEEADGSPTEGPVGTVRFPSDSLTEPAVGVVRVGWVETLVMVLGDGVDVLHTGAYGDVPIQWNGTIEQVSMFAMQTGSVVVDLWKDVFANFPPTDADSITASAQPALSSDDAMSDSILTGWTKTLTAGDVVRVNVDSVTTITQLTIALKVRRT